MAFFYEENSVRTGAPPDPYKMDATKMWLKHFDNSLFLMAVIKAPKSPDEKRQAEKELAIAEKKMVWWSRMPNYNNQLAANEVRAKKALWGKH